MAGIMKYVFFVHGVAGDQGRSEDILKDCMKGIYNA